MIHFFPLFADDPDDSPIAVELRRLGVAHRLLGRSISLKYRTRLGLVLLGWPRMIFFALRSAWRSLVKADVKPDVVVLGSHFEVLIFGAMRALVRGRRHPLQIVLMSFIYTSRSRPLLRWLRERYFGVALRVADIIVCHSSNELRQYGELFPFAKEKFRFMPYGMYISGEEEFAGDAIALPVMGRGGHVLAAGRSGRDYATLVQAVTATGITTHIVCDRSAATTGIELPPNVSILSSCYGDAYINELRTADMIVVPLLVDDISAGQMVLIQAMAFRKPMIITRTTTIAEYVEDGRECLLVPRGDAAALRSAIERVLSDPGLALRLANGARRSFDERFSMRAYVTNLVALIQGAQRKS